MLLLYDESEQITQRGRRSGQGGSRTPDTRIFSPSPDLPACRKTLGLLAFDRLHTEKHTEEFPPGQALTMLKSEYVLPSAREQGSKHGPPIPSQSHCPSCPSNPQRRRIDVTPYC